VPHGRRDVVMSPPEDVDLIDVSPEAARLGRRGADPVPRERRRQPRAHGLEHAAPGGAAAPADAPLVGTGMEASSPATPASPSSPSATASSTRSTRRASSSASTAEIDPTKPGVDIYNLMSSSSARTRTPASTSARSSRSATRSRRATSSPTVPRPNWASWRSAERARRVHAVERLQLRRLDPDLRAHRQGRRVHLDPHRGVRVMARDTKLGKEEITRDIPNVGEEALEPRRSRASSHRRRGQARRHPGRQDHARRAKAR
jgi:DNA-directed RNA polymerase subunit beta